MMKKRSHIHCVHVVTVILLVCATAVSSRLEFRVDGTFKILQLTDLHLGESFENDVATLKVRFRSLRVTFPLVILSVDNQDISTLTRCLDGCSIR